MRIPNKFNGYSRDGVRLYNDPVTLAVAAETAAAASSAAAAGTTIAAAAPTLAAAGSTMAAAAPEIAAAVAPQIAATSAAPSLAGMTGAELAGGAGANAGLMSAEVAAAQGAGAGAGSAGITAGGAGGAEMTLEQQIAAAKENAARELALRGGNVQGPAAQSLESANAAQQSGELPQYLREAQTILPEPPPPPVPTGADAVRAAQASSQQVSQFAPEIPKGIGAEPPTNSLLKGAQDAFKWMGANKTETGLGLMAAGQYMNRPDTQERKKYTSTVDMSKFQPTMPTQQPFERSYEWQGYAVGGPVEEQAAMNAVGANSGYPQANLQTPMYSNPAVQRPQSTNVIAPSADAGVDAYTGEAQFAEGGLSEESRREYGILSRKERAARGLSQAYSEQERERTQQLGSLKSLGDKFDEGIIPRSRTQQLTSPYSAAMSEYAKLAKKSKVPVSQMPKTNLGDIDNYMDTPIEAARGGIMHGLGGYSDGGRLLRGPGDGVSDSIPAVIGDKQPARLADGEFVIPARIVSELGNGSTEAGARKLYAMMERIQASRKKSIGKKKVAVDSKSSKHLPA